jgi:hypothetical protein
MLVRFWISVAMLFAAGTAVAETLHPAAARDFIAGKLFEFTCFEGSRGAGRIHSDGSVEGSIQLGGRGEQRYVVLPKGTLRVRGDAYCASLRGLPFEPCFEINKRDDRSFSGSVSGFSSAFCDFTRRSDRPVPAGPSGRLRSSQPLQLTPQLATRRAVHTSHPQ